MKEYKEGRMTDKISSLFSDIEIQKRGQINSLMSDWLSGIERKYEAEPDDELWAEGPPRMYFVSDGFFPGYYNQKMKILFIGRETRYIDGDCIQCTINQYKNDKRANNKDFTRRLLYIVQGIKHKGEYKFENLEWADDYAKEMVDTNDYGFAFMNMSKYANFLDDYRADYDFINQFLEDSNWENRNYFREELEILDPDIIITMNLWDGNIDRKYLDLCFGKIELDTNDGKVKLANIILNNKNVKILDTYHFSKPLSDQKYFYDPLMELIFGKRDKTTTSP
jgi:hypothetical protein